MTKKQQNNHLGLGCLIKIKIMILSLLVIFRSCGGLLLNNYLCHGASGIARHKKQSSSVEDVLLPIIAISTLRRLAMSHGVSSGELTKNRKPTISIVKMVIKVNNFKILNYYKIINQGEPYYVYSPS